MKEESDKIRDPAALSGAEGVGSRRRDRELLEVLAEVHALQRQVSFLTQHSQVSSS